MSTLDLNEKNEKYLETVDSFSEEPAKDLEKNTEELQIVENDEELEGSCWVSYPKIVFLIILNEFCERFSFYGLKTVLYIYFKNFIKLDKDTATVVYHTYSLFCYFTPVIGNF